MRVLCYKCGWEWNYKGKQRGKAYICCPKCSYKLKLDRSIIEDLHSSQEGLHTYIHSFKGNLHSFPEKLHTSFERVYFPNGFDCLVHKDIAAQFRELTLKDLKDKETVGVLEQEEKPVVEFQLQEGSNLCEDHKLSASYDSFEKKWLCNKCRNINIFNGEQKIYNSFTGEVEKVIKFRTLGEKATIREIKNDLDIKIIPRDSIKLLEHQRSFI